MKRVEFSLYNGMAGDSHLLLMGKNEDGIKVSKLYNRNGLFKLYRLRSLKKKLLKELELCTGKAHKE